MKRTLWVVLLALGLAGVQAQTFDPKLAYTRGGGNSSSLVLANEDGSGAVSVYTSKKALGPIDFRPGGGQIAFAEQGILKLLNYTTTATGVSVGSVVSLLETTQTRPDYSPDGGSLIYVASGIYGREIRKISTAGGPPQTLIFGDLGYAFAPLDLAWMRDGYRFVYLNNPYPGSTYEIRLVILGPDRSTVISDNVLISTDGSGLGFGNIWGLDTARMRDSVLFTAGYAVGSPYPVRTLEYKLADNSITYYPAVFSGRLSADDSRILHLDINRDYVQSYVVATGQTTRLVKRGRFGWVDARPDAAP